MVDESYNFDDNTLQGWTVEESADISSGVAAAAALNSSSYGIEINVIATTGDYGSVYKSLATTYTDLYTRFRFRVATGSGFSFPDKSFALVKLNTSSIFNGVDYLYAYWSGGVWNLRDSTGLNAHALSYDTDHEIECRYVIHGTTGGFQVWLDGALVIDDLAYDTSGTTIGHVQMGYTLPNSTILSGSLFYVDEIEFASTRIGGSASITDINTDEIVTDGETGVTFTTSGFSSEISTVQLVSGSSITNGSSVSSTSGTGTFSLPDITLYTGDVIGCPLTTANNIVVARLTDA